MKSKAKADFSTMFGFGAFSFGPFGPGQKSGMKRLLILTAVATLAASAGGARLPRRGGPSQVPANCPLTIAFGSYGPGIDGPTLANVERMLRTDRRVRSVSRHNWGREGEVTLCVRPRRIADAGLLARHIRAMIPARPRGPVQVELPGRLPY